MRLSLGSPGPRPGVLGHVGFLLSLPYVSRSLQGGGRSQDESLQWPIFRKEVPPPPPSGNNDSLLFQSLWAGLGLRHLLLACTPAPLASRGLSSPSPGPRELWALPETKLFVGRSKSLQLGDSLIIKPPHTLLEAELLSLRFLFRVGGEPDWRRLQ